MSPSKKKLPLTDAQKIEIVELYRLGETSTAKLGELYNRTAGSIRQLLHRRGIPVRNDRAHYRKYPLNEKYFDVIDTEPKAYFLGFLYADGYNCVTRNMVCVTLQEKDAAFLHMMNLHLGSNRPLLFIKTKDNNFIHKKFNIKKKFKNAQNSYRLAICNKYMSQQLSALGCVQKKSLVLTFPSHDIVPKHLLNHFLRGYFDGDGSCSASQRHGGGFGYSLSCVSTKSFCESILNIWRDTFGYEGYIRHPPKYAETTRELIISGKKIFKVLDWMYDGATVYLERKYQKYVLIKSQADLRDHGIKAFKYCKACNQVNYARCLMCKHCGTIFPKKADKTCHADTNIVPHVTN